MLDKLFPNTENHTLVVGAGPTGLTLANALCDYEVPFCIVEKKTSLSGSSKGLSLNVSSQVALSNLEIEKLVTKDGCQIKRLHLSLDGKRSSVVDFTRLSPPRHLVTQPQSLTEENLNQALTQKGKQVLWGHTLVDVRELDKGYEAILAAPTGQTVTKRFQYVVGCEGKHSIIRDKIGSKFEGPDYPMSFVLGDFEVSGKHSINDVYYSGSNEHFHIIIPIGQTQYRILAIIDDHNRIRDNINEHLKDIGERFFGKNTIHSPPSWTSSARIYLRIADKLQKNDMFICGDSSHLVSPIGGTGMNMGIQDAMNLAYKIAYVYHRIRPMEFLTTYEKERMPEITKTCLRADFMTKLIIDSEFRDANIRAFLPLMSNRRLLKTEFPKNFSGIDLQYQSNADYHFNSQTGKLFPARGLIIDAIQEKHKRLKTLAIFCLGQNGDITQQQNIKEVFNMLMDIDFIGVLVVSNDCVHYHTKSDCKQLDLNLDELDKGISLISPEGINEASFELNQINSFEQYVRNNF